MAAGKRIRAAYEGVDRDGLVSLDDAVKMVKERATAKFDETSEISMTLGIEMRCGSNKSGERSS